MSLKKPDSLEISSSQIHTDLTEIKARIGALEKLTSLANRPIVEAHAKEALATDAAKKLVSACEEPKTKEELRILLGYKSIPALDHHLKQIREHNVLETEMTEGGKLTFRWTNLFAGLPKKTIANLLGAPTKTSSSKEKKQAL